MYITYYENEGVYAETRMRWLKCHGGRTEGDVLFDEMGEYIVLTNGRQGEYRKHLPKEFQKEYGI